MAYFEGQGQPWPQHRRPDSWSQSGPPSSAGGSTPGAPAPPAPPAPAEDMNAFGSQFEEIARASENLTRNIKMLGMHGRRESMPNAAPFARQYPDFDSRVYGGSTRHHSVGDYDNMRAPSSQSSSSLQGYLAHQRFGSRPSEADQMMQVKRRAAAQRERELRNYHQEQQFNRSTPSSSSKNMEYPHAMEANVAATGSSGPKSDRSMSPAGMSEDDRKELIARQHRALYGEGSNLYMGEHPAQRQSNQDARALGSGTSSHGSPSIAPYEGNFQGMPNATSEASSGGVAVGPSGPQQSRSRTNSTASKSPNPSSFPIFDPAQQANRTSASSPGGSPTRSGLQGPNIGPIGSRPSQVGNQGSRKTPPMPSPLSYGYNNSSDKAGLNTSNPSAGSNNSANPHSATERSSSSASNPATSGPEKAHLGWPAQSGPWGSSKNLGVQASVWG